MKKSQEWVVIRTGKNTTGGDIYRYMIDNPSVKMRLWDKGQVGIRYMPWWQMSKDGKICCRNFFPGLMVI